MTLPLHKLKMVLACWGLAAAPASGAVVFTDMPDRGFYSFGDWITQSIDFNADGIDDMVFRNFGDEFAAFSTSTSAIAGIAARPPNQNSFAIPFESGSLIGTSFSSSSLYTWNEGYSGLISVRLVGFDTVVLGFWGGIEAYLGVQFEIDGNTHYGWVLVENLFDDVGGGIIKAFAYESEAGVPIVAGEIPEPSAALMASAGLAGGCLRRRRQR